MFRQKGFEAYALVGGVRAWTADGNGLDKGAPPK